MMDDASGAVSMFQAHVHGKLGAVLRRVDESIDTRRLDEALRESEDVLTSEFFGRMVYLDPTVAWDLVVGPATALRGAAPTAPARRIEQKFWPRYCDSSDGSRVEPDVVWSFGSIRLVVEAKWRDGHTPEQLDREYRAVVASEPAECVAILALGNTPPAVRRTLAVRCNMPVLLAASWTDIHTRLVEAQRNPRHALCGTAALDDLLLLLRSRGLRELQLLDTLEYHRGMGLCAPNDLLEAWRMR
jgi:hypothetical protein